MGQITGMDYQNGHLYMSWSTFHLVFDGAFLYRDGPDYRNGLPEWTFICVIEYFSFGF